MIAKAKLAPPNSILLIKDRNSGDVPRSLNNNRFGSTPSCIVVGTLCMVDGETSIILTDEEDYSNLDDEMQKVFSGVLATPTREVQVCTSQIQIIAKLFVPSTRCNVEIWSNHVSEPNSLYVRISS